MTRHATPLTASSAAVLAAAVLAAAAPASTAAADPAATAAADHALLQQWRFGTCAVEVPEGGLTWSRDTATWTLESGRLWLMEPTAAGAVTGAVFTGQGRFVMSIPDPVEREHLARATANPARQGFAEPFSEAVIRFSDDPLSPLLAGAAAAGGGCAHQPNRLAAERHEEWLERWGFDADARVLAGLLTPGDRYLRVDMKSEPLDWLVYEYDGLAREEITVSSLRRATFVETWISLDRPEDRRPDGRPNGARRPLIDVEHVALTVDLSERSQMGSVGLSETGLRWAQVTAEVSFDPLADGPRALGLYLSSLARVESVRAEDGTELAFLRDHLGARTRQIDKRIWDSSLVVVLDRPLARGEARTLTFSYELVIANYAQGRSWYPGLPDNFTDAHTADLTYLHKKRQEVRSIGELERSGADGGVVVSEWKVTRPTKMVSFAYGEGFKEEVLEVEGVPRVVSFGRRLTGGAIGDMTRNVGADVVNSLRFFQWLFDSELPVEQIQLTSIASGHGQAFEGFLHMSEYTYHSEVHGVSEMFRAHETAHQWWGHEITWGSYRDQWLSEALAEYSAMLYVQTTMKDGAKVYDDIVEAYTNLLIGSREGLFSNFARPWLVDVDLDNINRLGPICLGYRAATAEIPAGYQIQVYHKGPLVLHTLRSLLAATGEGEGAFVAVLRDFARTHRGGVATTEDFVAAVNRHAPGDWSWFFDQWLCGTGIPTLAWSHEVREGPGGDGGAWQLALSVRQEDVPAGFVSAVPVRVDFGGDRSATYIARIDQPEVTVTLPLPARPRNVELNPGNAVLARVKGR